MSNNRAFVFVKGFCLRTVVVACCVLLCNTRVDAAHQQHQKLAVDLETASAVHCCALAPGPSRGAPQRFIR